MRLHVAAGVVDIHVSQRLVAPVWAGEEYVVHQPWP